MIAPDDYDPADLLSEEEKEYYRAQARFLNQKSRAWSIAGNLLIIIVCGMVGAMILVLFYVNYRMAHQLPLLP